MNTVQIAGMVIFFGVLAAIFPTATAIIVGGFLGTLFAGILIGAIFG